jgi:hypothetical protein
MPSGDSIHACFTVTPQAPLGTFTIEQFITDRIVSVPVRPPTVGGPLRPSPFALPEVKTSPLKTLCYITAQSSTRDLIAAGLGIETTASSVAIDTLGNITLHERMRISGEALVLPKLPGAYLQVRGYYFF